MSTIKKKKAWVRAQEINSHRTRPSSVSITHNDD